MADLSEHSYSKIEFKADKEADWKIAINGIQSYFEGLQYEDITSDQHKKDGSSTESGTDEVSQARQHKRRFSKTRRFRRNIFRENSIKRYLPAAHQQGSTQKEREKHASDCESEPEDILFTVDLETHTTVGETSSKVIMKFSVPNVESITFKCPSCKMPFEKQLSEGTHDAFRIHICDTPLPSPPVASITNHVSALEGLQTQIAKYTSVHGPADNITTAPKPPSADVTTAPIAPPADIATSLKASLADITSSLKVPPAEITTSLSERPPADVNTAPKTSPTDLTTAPKACPAEATTELSTAITTSPKVPPADINTKPKLTPAGITTAPLGLVGITRLEGQSFIITPRPQGRPIPNIPNLLSKLIPMPLRPGRISPPVSAAQLVNVVRRRCPVVTNILKQPQAPSTAEGHPPHASSKTTSHLPTCTVVTEAVSVSAGVRFSPLCEPTGTLLVQLTPGEKVSESPAIQAINKLKEEQYHKDVDTSEKSVKKTSCLHPGLDSTAVGMTEIPATGAVQKLKKLPVPSECDHMVVKATESSTTRDITKTCLKSRRDSPTTKVQDIPVNKPCMQPGLDSTVVRATENLATRALKKLCLQAERDAMSVQNVNFAVTGGGISDDGHFKKRRRHIPSTVQCTNEAELQIVLKQLQSLNNASAKEKKVRKAKSKTCDICGKVYSHRPSLLHHMRSHTGERPFECDVCGKSFMRSSTLNEHLRIHDDVSEKRFICEICGKKFIRKGDHTIHVLRHTKEYRHWCPDCGKGFVLKLELERHIITHTREIPFLCTICGGSFRHNSTIQVHLHRHKIADDPLRCSSCDTTYMDRDQLRTHVCSTEKNLVCKVCGGNFCSRPKLKEHMKIHTHPKASLCASCHVMFSNEFELQKHYDENIVKCSTCDMLISDARLCMLNKLPGSSKGKTFKCWTCHSTKEDLQQLSGGTGKIDTLIKGRPQSNA